MPLFNYKAIDEGGKEISGRVDAIGKEVAIGSLQSRGLTVMSVESAEDVPFLKRSIGSFERVSTKDVVILSRQISTLFHAHVSALKAFEMLATETQSEGLKKALFGVADDIKAGSSMANAMAKHPKVFSNFYVNMVRAGEESGNLEGVFESLADYLDRNYELTSKARNALVYPSFVVVTFIVVMSLMLTKVIPKISSIITESGQDVPLYTKIVIGISEFLVDYGVFILALLAAGVIFLIRYVRTEKGRLNIDSFKLEIPYIGSLYRTLFLSRIADNMDTLLTAGIPMLRSLEVTATVVDNAVYEDILKEIENSVKGGSLVSDAMSAYPEIPSIMTSMVKIGEETGELGSILNTLALFYKREVDSAVETLVSLIEPVLIVLLAAGVGVLLASVLIPIYNISSAI